MTLIVYYFSHKSIGTCDTHDRQYSASCPVLAARVAYYNRRKWATGVSSDAPPCGLPHGAARCGGRWPYLWRWPVKYFFPVFSLLHAKVQERPPVLQCFHFRPWTFNFLYGPDFCYISFDLIQSSHSIEINYILMFHFGSPSFNFWIEFKYLNIFGTEVVIFSIFLLIKIDNIMDFKFGPYTFNFLF